ncbi:MAG: glutaminase A [Burkholderiales bacterium]|nr:glutaminase A [Burkholderiales bacterium]
MTYADASSAIRSPVQACLEQLHARLAGPTAGQVATYIPELAKVDPALFGIVIATVDGRLYEVGDTRVPFTLQSISKPLVYGVALEDQGTERVHRAVGVEPSGEAFNAISLEPGTGRPMNPMINAGAIACSSLVAGASAQARRARVLDAISAYAGRPLAIDEAVFESERATGHRNRAIGHMLRNYGIIEDDPELALDLYFQQCSVQVDCRDLALIAATLANGGVNPLTARRAVRAEYITAILSVMTTCGVYDFTGGWVFNVGLPAKSGVGGGVLAVLPGQLGIGVFSPALDERGNSVRGVQVCEALSSELALHFLQPPRPSAATVRARYTLAEVRSKRRRGDAERRVLDEHGRRAAVYELQGDLRFSTIEQVVREITEAAPAGLDFAVLDFKRVSHADQAATRLLAQLVGYGAAHGLNLVLTRVRRGELLAAFGNELDPQCARSVSFQPQLDLGLEWCERGLLQRHGAAGTAGTAGARCSLAEHGLCAGMSPADLALLQACVEPHQFDAGMPILRRGDPGDALYLLLRGEVSVTVELPGGGHKRLSTLTAGMSFGELALVNGGLRSADVRADTQVECCALPTTALARLEAERPSLMIRLLHNLLANATLTAVQLTAEVAALEA